MLRLQSAAELTDRGEREAISLYRSYRISFNFRANLSAVSCA